jgi:hypothetical protein
MYAAMMRPNKNLITCHLLRVDDAVRVVALKELETISVKEHEGLSQLDLPVRSKKHLPSAPMADSEVAHFNHLQTLVY